MVRPSSFSKMSALVTSKPSGTSSSPVQKKDVDVAKHVNGPSDAGLGSELNSPIHKNLSPAGQGRTTPKGDTKESNRLLWRDIYAEALPKKTFCGLKTRSGNGAKVILNQGRYIVN
ncbi:hypothetical protein DICVIV_07450 [Dictyocaulus viviparus]|uniref:Uncharacterized protein n=1 Tax=Dictyocaulus viviparus TaxID=29172 RepID=A0A0D8XVW8_DICVI|nr:hypothetical protein DICVIV_07450 [Dictyocaulus viviparus]